MQYPISFQIELFRKILNQKWVEVQVIADLLIADSHASVIKRTYIPYTIFEIIFKAGNDNYCYHFVYEKGVLIDACSDNTNEESFYLKKKGYKK